MVSPPTEETAFVVPTTPPPLEDEKLTEPENEQSKHAYSVALASAVAAEAAVAAAQAAAEVLRLTRVPYYAGKSKEEIAAITIQTAFRGYLVYLFTLFPQIILASVAYMHFLFIRCLVYGTI